MKNILEELKSRDIVEFSPRGNSMTPKIKSGQKVKIKKLSDEEKEKLKKGDIVFCKVRSNFYLHLVVSINSKQAQIGNNHGKINGWTDLKNIYAVLIK